MSSPSWWTYLSFRELFFFVGVFYGLYFWERIFISSFITMNLASLSVLAAVDPGLLLGQLLLFYPIEVFFFLGHGFFEGRVLPSGLASRSSWVDVSTVVRVIGLVAYIQCSCARPGCLLPRGGHTCRFERFSFSWASSAGCSSGRGFSSPLPLR
ncbi:hypothetical protein F2Q68_00026363 [Brassica cretica]|uniref:Uncharacterized protein n=1 Tax=Brassica cretica TaxID=69181 RepID=A0A8S9IB75_BRACR|nr:hypothetical protein F2Q68_00026363 [Brassica cretica]